MITTTTTITPDHARLRRQCRHLAELEVALRGDDRPVHRGAYDEISAEHLPGIVAGLEDSLRSHFAGRLGAYQAACEALKRPVCGL